MRARRAPARGLVALLLLCLLLAGVVAMEIRHPDALVLQVGTSVDGTPARLDPAPDGTAADGSYQPPGETVFRVIEQRPLFSPDRRPPEPDAEIVEAAPPAPMGLDGLALTGIIGAGTERVAIVESTGPPRPDSEALSLHVGDNLRGWTLEAIADDRIVLVHGEQRFEMELTEDPTRRRGVPRRPAAGGSRSTPGAFAPQPAPQPAPQRQAPQQPQSNR